MDQTNIQVMDIQLKQELGQIQDSIQHLDAKVSGIRSFLSGNELNKDDKGMVGIVNDLRVRVTEIEKLINRIFYIGIGMSIPAGVGVYELIRNIFIK